LPVEASARAALKTADEFPHELVDFVPYAHNPVFSGAGPGHWDAKIRERGWILREGDTYYMWYTGYDGTRDGLKMLGHATSPDGLTWTRHPANPIYRDHWVEDMMVVHHDDTYYMFSEGLNDQAELLTSKDRVHWKRQGPLDIRTSNRQPLSPGPYGTPTVWLEGGTWNLFYERRDAGVWLATSRDMKVWTNVEDEPVLAPGPGEYDRLLIALNQIVKHRGRYYAYYHGSGTPQSPRQWTTNVAVSADLVHWKKYPKNPLLADNESSGIVVDDGKEFRLYSMHDEVRVHFAQPE
jgi:predicted GH43/DUF377 family glycosyl hydrolase